MESKLERIIKEIAKMLEEALYEQDDFDLERDCEFGGVDASISATIKYKTCFVKCEISYHAHTEDWVEVFIEHENERHDLSNLENTVNEYVENHLDKKAVLDVMKEKVIENEEDEWVAHGFRNEADYLHWRYG